MATQDRTNPAGRAADRLITVAPEAATRSIGDAGDRIESIYRSAYALEAIARVLSAAEVADDERLDGNDRDGLLTGAEVLARSIQLDLHQIANLPAARG